MKTQHFGGQDKTQIKLRNMLCLCAALSCSSVINAGAAPPTNIVVRPTRQIGAVFGTATFSVSAESTLPLTYQWYFNGEALSNETNSALILGPLGYTENGFYNVVVSNSHGAASSPKAQLTVSEAIVSTNDYSNTNLQNFLLQFTNLVAIDASSSGPVFALTADGTVVCSTPSDLPSGLSNVVAIAVSDDDFFAALRSDGTTLGPYDSSGPSNITAISVGRGNNLALRTDGTVVAWGNGPGVTPLPLLSNVVAVAGGSAGFLALNADGTVVEQGVQTNPGPVLSNVIAISLNGGALALKEDGTVVGWDGFPTNPLPNVSNVVAIAAGDGPGWFLALESDGTLVGSSVVLDELPVVPLNVFSIFAGFPCAVLCNDGSPVITVQPGNQTPANGGTAWLHVRAVGTPPMSYQWQFDGLDIPDATNADLTITNMQIGDVGAYSATVSNAIASTSSRLASLRLPSMPSPETLGQALEATNLTWSTSGNADWFAETNITEDGIAAAQSGRITNSQSSELQTTVTGPGTLTFWWMVSSEEYFDLLSFYIGSETDAAATISGGVDWEQESFDIGPGAQTLSWIYSKDPDVTVGLDAGWLSQVNFTPTLPAQLGLPTLQADGTLLFAIYNTNGTTLSLSNSASVLFEASSNLVDWIPLTNAVTLTNGSVQLSDPSASNSPTRFYRLLRE